MYHAIKPVYNRSAKRFEVQYDDKSEANSVIAYINSGWFIYDDVNAMMGRIRKGTFSYLGEKKNKAIELFVEKQALELMTAEEKTAYLNVIQFGKKCIQAGETDRLARHEEILGGILNG